MDTTEPLRIGERLRHRYGGCVKYINENGGVNGKPIKYTV